MVTVDGSLRGLYWPTISMKRPSRGERLSAATTPAWSCPRASGGASLPCVFALLVEAGEPGRQLRHHRPPLALLLHFLGAQATHPLHQLLHLLELLHEAVDLAGAGAAAGGDA